MTDSSSMEMNDGLAATEVCEYALPHMCVHCKHTHVFSLLFVWFVLVNKLLHDLMHTAGTVRYGQTRTLLVLLCVKSNESNRIEMK